MRLQSTLILSVLTLVSFTAWSQENAAVLQGGYSFATVDGTSTQATGWRINGLYEFTPTGGKWALGGSIGYVSLSGTESTTPSTTTNYDLSSVPIYFAPKFMFGSDKFKGFLKGAIGMHFSSIKRTGALFLLEDNQSFFSAPSMNSCGCQIVFIKAVQ
jgi:hypothetical protein